MTEIFGLKSDDQIVGLLLIAVIVLAVLLIAAIVLLVLQILKTTKLEARLGRFMMGEDGMSLEDLFADRFNRIKTLEENDAVMAREIRAIIKKLQGAYQKTGIVKYDAFLEAGGKLSYALCMLDERDNGYIINCMNSREGSYSYIKDIAGGTCAIQLGEEEAKALELAKQGGKTAVGRRQRGGTY